MQSVKPAMDMQIVVPICASLTSSKSNTSGEAVGTCAFCCQSSPTESAVVCC